MAKKVKDNWIYTYYQRIKDGSETVGKYIELILEYLVKGIEDKRFYYDQHKANEVIEWIEAHAFHTEGKLAPGPLLLEIWEKAFIASIYGIVNEDGKRVFREVLLVIGRKNGKSLLASAIAKYEWLKGGGFGAKVYNIAPKLEQADIIYNNIWQMTLLDPEYQRMKEELNEKDEHNKRVNDDSMLPKHRMSDLNVMGTNSTVKKLPFATKRSDGFNPSFCCADEIASWEGDAGLKQYEVLRSGMGAREEPIMLSCTTAGYINDSIYDELMKRATRFLLGDSKETSLLPFLYIIDDIEKWNDINELRKSNPNLGVSISVDYMLNEIAIAEQSLSKKREFIVKYACLKQNSSCAWLDAQTVNKCFGDPLRLEEHKSKYGICGLDLSQTTDLTCATCIIEENGELYVFAKFWLPSEKIEEATARDGVPYDIYIQRGLLEASGDNFIDYHDCYDWFVSLVEEYEILPLVVGFDRWSASYLIQDLKNYGFQVDDVYQGDNLWGVLQEMEGLMKDGRVHCGDNDLLKIHLLNSAIKMNVERGRGKLVKINPAAHIDGCAALADAFCVRQKWYNEMKDRLQNKE